jgi:two-component system nitrogen regulation response regulator NtrX
MEILAAHIPPPYSREPEVDTAFSSSIEAPTIREAKENFEKAYLARKLQEYKWNISQTADAIGIERSNLHKKIKAYGLDTYRSP